MPGYSVLPGIHHRRDTKTLSYNLSRSSAAASMVPCIGGKTGPAARNKNIWEGVMMKTAVKAVEPAERQAKFDQIRPLYLDALTLVERLHRRLLDVIKDEFDRRGRSDINSVQALLLYNIGDKELTAGELRSRGYYLGSNVSYNLKKLVDLGFISHQRSRIDRRSVRVSLTPKGQAIAEVVAGLYERHIGSIEQVGGINTEEFKQMNRALLRLDRFWNDTIAYRM